MNGMPFEDEGELIKGCARKDLAAWSSFVKKYSGLIFISIENCLKKYGFTLPSEDIEDIRQETLTAIWKGGEFENIKGGRTLPCWIAIVSGNTAVSYMRNKKRHETLKTISIDQKDLEKELILFSNHIQSNELENNDMALMVSKYISSLPRKERLILKLNLMHDKKYHEIASILNIPKGTVSSYIKRAKERLREKLKE